MALAFIGGSAIEARVPRVEPVSLARGCLGASRLAWPGPRNELRVMPGVIPRSCPGLRHGRVQVNR